MPYILSHPRNRLGLTVDAVYVCRTLCLSTARNERTLCILLLLRQPRTFLSGRMIQFQFACVQHETKNEMAFRTRTTTRYTIVLQPFLCSRTGFVKQLLEAQGGCSRQPGENGIPHGECNWRLLQLAAVPVLQRTCCLRNT